MRWIVGGTGKPSSSREVVSKESSETGSIVALCCICWTCCNDACPCCASWLQVLWITETRLAGQTIMQSKERKEKRNVKSEIQKVKPV